MPHALKISSVALGLSALLISACQSGPAPATPTASAPATTVTVTEYTLSSGDQVKVTVFGQPDLSGQFEVDGSGTFSMPLIGQVSAEGLSVPQLESTIAAALADGYLVNPQVSAEVANYRPYYILGEVRNPGEYPYTNGLTVMEAVASAGGFTYRARKNVVFVRATDANAEQSVALTATTQVKPGDTLRIGERIF
ncbi:MAG: polysaccharide export protein [Hyphomonadaceae bacterium]|nr:polysaccharide export protein [Hyphomonadaceae bacterium]